MPTIEHVFVLMLENRSFNHLFGFSGLTGLDGATGAPTAIDGLTGREANALAGITYAVQRGAEYVIPFDPGHDFEDVLDQLCGTSRYGAPYPSITNAGFVESYSRTGGYADPAEIMKCFDTARQLPVLHTLAREFAICDRWFSSMPGPTWPNRLFVHAASSGGLDHRPSTAEILEWELLSGLDLPKGHVFAALKRLGVPYHLYSGDEFPMVSALRGIGIQDVHRIDALLVDLQKDPFPYRYVFIEPSYEILNGYRGSNSQHPLGDVRDGERLVKQVYEAIRASKVWESSLLLVTWDEHGGFFDHVAPPAAVAPGDTLPGSKLTRTGFTFPQYGFRVPALVISPLVPRGTIDHRVRDHSSVLSTLEALFRFSPLTARDAAAASVLPLLSLEAPRSDAPVTLPAPQASSAVQVASAALTRPDASVNDGMLASVVHAAMRLDLQLDPSARPEILAKVASLATRGDARCYLEEVRTKLRAH